MSLEILVLEVRRVLAETNELTSLLGSDDKWGPWIFRWQNRVTLEGSASSLVVVRAAGQWASPNNHNTAKFPRLQLEIRSDSPRRPDGTPSEDTPEEQVLRVWKAADKVLHRPGGEIRWGSLRVTSSARGSMPSPAREQEETGTASALAEWNVTL